MKEKKDNRFDKIEDESVVQLELPSSIYQELEEIFNKICYIVREKTDNKKEELPDQGARSYGVELLQEIDRRKKSKIINEEEFQYCLNAANEILNMEVLFFENQFRIFQLDH